MVQAERSSQGRSNQRPWLTPIVGAVILIPVAWVALAQWAGVPRGTVSYRIRLNSRRSGCFDMRSPVVHAVTICVLWVNESSTATIPPQAEMSRARRFMSVTVASLSHSAVSWKVKWPFS
jgi:hypothetical protein